MKFHHRNWMSWVGEAHNRGIDAYLADKRSRKFTSRNLCKDVVNFFDEHSGIYPKGRPKPTPEQRRAGNRIGIGLLSCGRGLAEPHSRRFGLVGVSTPFRATEPSPEAMALVTEIEAALDVASTPESLAGALTEILDKTSQLNSAEADDVAAIASVTQSSYEYWDANYLAVSSELAAEIATEYPECVDASDPSNCFAEVHNPTPGSQPFLMYVSARRCPLSSWRASAKDIVKADFAGAFSGAIYGGWATGGLSIIGSAVVASVGAMVWNVAIDIACWLL